LEFLKIQSEISQIIISTHSPQSLDILEEEEFNRIIIAYIKNSKEGTKMRHLNEGELLKAKRYIKDDYLSDYWLYSDLEKY
jgi:predicted ATPase